jgi:hypothetical protein
MAQRLSDLARQTVADDVVERLSARHRPDPRAVEMGVDLFGDPHRSDDAGHNWTRLSTARDVREVLPGAAVLLGSRIGRYLARVVAWEFDVSETDPVVVLDILPLRPSEVDRLLRSRREAPADERT